MSGRSFLLSEAHLMFARNIGEWRYDDVLCVNMTQNKDGIEIPVCSISSAITESKSFTAETDDDPDSDAELCY